MNKMFEELLHNKSAFKYMSVVAVLTAIGSILNAGIDLFWLVGDMMVNLHFHHYIVFIGLSLANIIFMATVFWLIKGIMVYVNTHDKKVKEKTRTKKRISKQSELIIKLTQRIDELEVKLNDKA